VTGKSLGNNKVTAEAKPDLCLFTAFALLNVTGYNTENGWQFTKVRKAVRLRLSHRSTYWRSALSDADLLEPIQRAGGGMLMDIVPFLSPPPDFVIQADGGEYTTSWQRESRSALEGIDQWLRRFYEKESIESLWSEHLGAYEDGAPMLQRLGPSLEAIAGRFGEPLNSTALEIVLMPNLLDAKGRGYSLSTPQCTWLFLGPVDEPSQAEGLAVHELLHRWVDLAADKTVRNGGGTDSVLKARALFPIVARSYPDLAIWISETVVRAATAWLGRSPRKATLQSTDESIANYERMGFIGIQEAYRHLVGEPERPPLKAIEQAIELVHRRVLTELGSTE